MSWRLYPPVAAFALLLAAAPGSASAGSAGEIDNDKRPAADWRHGLKQGPNGPIPLIVVDQFGYLPGSYKVAIIRSPQTGYDNFVHFDPGTRYAVIDKSSNTAVKVGAPVPWNKSEVDPTSGDKVWRFSFSEIAAPGKYFVADLDNGVRSPDFEIGETVYRGVLRHALRMFFYQRAGFAKIAKYAGDSWADDASHLGARQDPEARAWLAKDDASQARDLRGGWYDAGDYNKYTSWTATNIIRLLKAYLAKPNAFGDDIGIPESGNGVPDILDEVKWGLDWLVRMQSQDGSLLCVQSLDRASPPSAAKGPSFYGPPTTSASLMGAAAFAFAAKIYMARPEAELKRFGLDLAARAEKAWAWAEANPAVLYFNNDDSKQPGSRGLAAGQQEMTDAERRAARFEAAVHLYALTGRSELKTVANENVAAVAPPYSVTQWTLGPHEVALDFAQLAGVEGDTKARIMSQFVSAVSKVEFQLPLVVRDADPYLAPIKDYVWGSNQSKAAQARIYQLYASLASDREAAIRATRAAEGYLHYLHGVNPLGLVYLTNMSSAGAEHSADSMFHFWFAHGNARWSRTTDKSPGPPPGYLLGGPNPAFKLDAQGSDLAKSCASGSKPDLCNREFAPPLRQPPLKSYLQFNDDWPLNSWEVTEPSTGYQAIYILALAPYVN